MKYIIEIEASGAAFANGNADAEVGRILQEVMRTFDFTDSHISNEAFVKPLRDINGNKCGELRGVA